MQSQNEYIGDEKFQKFLEHYSCEVPLDVIKMRFAGAICSPNENLRPADVISSFWSDGQSPRLETKNEAELFFKFFMGLFDKIFEDVVYNKLQLPKKSTKQVAYVACARYEEVAFGFLEGFWGGKEDLNIPAYIGQVVDSLADLANVYQVLERRAQKGEENELLFQTCQDTDKMVEKAFSFLIENYALKKIKNIQEKVSVQ